MRYAISNGKILNICANEDVYARGESYYRDGKLVSLHAKRQGDSTVIKAAVKGNYRNYDVALNFDISGELTRYTCSCASGSIWQGGCKHVVAVLFAISDGRAHDGTNKGRQDLETLTDTLEKLILQEVDDTLDVPAKLESSRLAKFVPRFHYRGEGEAYLTFYVGYSRMYTIKSLSKFLRAVRSSETVRYGNGLEFNHSITSFTVAGRRWINFLKQEEDIYGEMVKRIARHHPYATKEDIRELPLSQRNMDIFFDLCDNTAIEWDAALFTSPPGGSGGFGQPGQPGRFSQSGPYSNTDPSLLKLTTEMPSIRFEVIDNVGGEPPTGDERLTVEGLAVDGLAVDGLNVESLNVEGLTVERLTAERLILKGQKIRYHLLKGQLYNYFLTQNTLHRMTKAEAKILAYIADAQQVSAVKGGKTNDSDSANNTDDSTYDSTIDSTSDSTYDSTIDSTSESIGTLEFSGYARRRFISAVMPKLAAMGLLYETKKAQENICPNLLAKVYFDAEGYDIIGRVIFSYGKDYQYDAFDQRESHIPRDIAGEYALRRILDGLSFTADAENRTFRLSGSEQLYAFMGDTPAGIEKLQSLEKAEIYVTDKLRRKTVKAEGATLGVRLRGRLLDIHIQGSDFTLEELVEALESYHYKKKYHRLKDGRLLSLTDPDTAKLAESLSAIDIEPKDLVKQKDLTKDSQNKQQGEEGPHQNILSLPLYRAPYIEGKIQDQNPAFKKLMRQFHGKETFNIPASLEEIMRPYQKDGFQWIKNLFTCGFCGILADDMGLGKTLQVLAVLLEDGLHDRPALVVAPTSLIYNWAAEIKKFAPGLTFGIVAGTPEKRLEILMTQEVKVFITTYDSMKRDAEIYQDIRYKYLIADEAQNIKNPATKNAKVIKSIQADNRIALTGTPIENTLTELWSLFDFVMPGYLYNARKFAKLYEVPITKEGNKEKAARLKEQISPFILRRLKKNVLDELPEKTETTLVAEMLPEQQRIYMAHLLKARGDLKELLSVGSLKTGRLQILAQLTRLRQICCHPSLCIENYRGGSGKLDLALETLEIAIESGHRCLLFSQFTKMLDILQKALQKSGISYFYLDGTTPTFERMERVNQFNAGERDVFLISLKAGGTGLNLTGADIVIHYDPWWNPSVMDQASDRTYRIGQTKAVQVFNLVAMQTLEERIMELQAKKRKLIDEIFSDKEGGALQALTDEEIEELLDG